MELIQDQDGKPTYYREKSPIFSSSWGQKVTHTPLYPAGMLIEPRTSSAQAAAASARPISIDDIDSAHVRALAQVNSPVVLRGFAKTVDRDKFIAKSHEFGKPTPWLFGLLLEVKDRGLDTRGLNNVLSAEWMPFHYDGLFKTVKRVLPDGREGLRSVAPK